MSDSVPRYWSGPAPSLAPEEQFVASYPANRTQGKRAVGGGLHITTRRLLFRPHAIDAHLGGKAWECALADITAAGVEPGRFSLLALFSGGLAQRLRVHVEDRVELFVISDPAKRAAELSAICGGSLPRGPAELPAARVVRE